MCAAGSRHGTVAAAMQAGTAAGAPGSQDAAGCPPVARPATMPETVSCLPLYCSVAHSAAAYTKPRPANKPVGPATCLPTRIMFISVLPLAAPDVCKGRMLIENDKSTTQQLQGTVLYWRWVRGPAVDGAVSSPGQSRHGPGRSRGACRGCQCPLRTGPRRSCSYP